MYSVDTSSTLPLPFMEGARIPAGFASPAEDFQIRRLDVGELLLMQHPATFCMRASGHSMVNAGIQDGDLLVINRAITPQHGYVVVAQIDDGFTVKYLYKRGPVIKLLPANPAFPEILPADGQTLAICGVVIGALTLFPPSCIK